MAFSIDGGTEKRIEILTNAKWRKSEIRIDGNPAASLSKNELYAGYDIPLSDGSILNFKLAKHVLQPDRMQITKNGHPIAPLITSYDNQMMVNNAANTIYIVAFINLIVGIISLFVKIEAFALFKFGWMNVAIGLVFLLLAIFAQRKSFIAMLLFIIIFGIDSLSYVVLSLATGNYFVILVFLVRIVFLGPVFLGLGEIFRKKNKFISKIFSIIGAAAMVAAMLGMLAILAWAIMNVITTGKQLTPYFSRASGKSATISAPLAVPSGGSCNLKIKDTAKSVNIRDKADSSTGKVVDYLSNSDVATVLGSDGGTAGNEWWLIEVLHDGKTVRGWVTGKWVDIENSASCSKLQSIATPTP